MHHHLGKSRLAVCILLLPLIAFAIACTSTPAPAPEPAAPDAQPPASAPTTAPQAGATTAPVAEPAEATPSYWTPPTDFYGQPIYGGHLRINFEDPMEHANPWGAFSAATVRFRIPAHNSLVGENPYAPGEIIPDLAREWEDHDDMQGLTFHFEDGIKWHDGTDFTCEDARFSIETMATGNGLTASEMTGKLAFIDVPNTKCEDDGSLSVRFKGPSSTALIAFIDRAFLIFNKQWFEEGGEEAMFNDVSMGTGPFMWSEGQSVGVDEQNFERNPDYFKPGLPFVDNLTIFGILDESAQQAAMLAHQTDWHWVRNFGQYDAYVAHDQIQTVIRPTRGHHAVWMNKANPPFDNVRVRQALYMSVDRAAGINVLLDGHGSLGFIMAPGSSWELSEEQGCAVPAWCPPANGDYAAQREEAKSILEEEGFPFDQTFVMTVEADEQVQARATFFQEQLRLLGLQTTFDPVESIAWRQQVTTGGWGDFTNENATMPADDPALGMGFYFRCNSATNFWTPQTDCDPKSEELLDKVSSITDPAMRKQASDELQLYLMEQYQRYPLFWEQEAAAFWPEVRGYVHQPQPSGPFVRWEHAWIDPAHEDDSGFSGQTTGIPGGL